VAERTDLTTFWQESPRIIEVASPSSELVIQDLHDTLRSNTEQAGEGDLDNLDDDQIIDSAGKEDLGGGTLVGITSTLQNAQVAFESRLTPTSTGTVTTSDINGNTLTDSGATFITDGVERGAVVINFVDESITEVLEVLGETQIRTRVLRAGSDNQFDLNDTYKIWNVQQCNIAGGNLVSLNDVNASISPVFPTAFTQIIRTASVSATLQEQAELQFASFDGGVTLDETSSFSGIGYPVGTPGRPVNNQADMLAIAIANGLDKFYVRGNITVASGLDFSDYTWIGASQRKTTITVPGAATVTDCEFENCEVTGDMDGVVEIREAEVNAVTNLAGGVFRSGLFGVNTAAAGGSLELVDCYSEVAGGGPGQTAELQVMDADVIVRRYTGGLTLSEKTGAGAVSVDILSGQVVVDDSCVSGVMTLRGIGKWTNYDTYVGSTAITNELIEAYMIREMYQDRGLDAENPKVITENTPGTSYDEDFNGITKTVRKVGSVTTVTRI